MDAFNNGPATISDKWYRFMGNGGNVIPEKCPAKERCRTHATAWINDTHPADFNVKTVNTCANWDSNCCYKKSTAKVSIIGVRLFKALKP